MHLIQYAVRVKGTQCYLPRSQRRDGRGGSHLEPIDFSKPPNQRGVAPMYEKNMMIRTFTTHGAAANLLSSWLQGAVGCSRYSDSEDWYEESYHIPKPHRRAENMEIVELHLELPQP